MAGSKGNTNRQTKMATQKGSKEICSFHSFLTTLFFKGKGKKDKETTAKSFRRPFAVAVLQLTEEVLFIYLCYHLLKKSQQLGLCIKRRADNQTLQMERNR